MLCPNIISSRSPRWEKIWVWTWTKYDEGLDTRGSPPCQGNKKLLASIGNLSAVQFAMVRAAVSIYNQHAVAQNYRQRAVAETNTRVLHIQIWTNLVTGRAELLCVYWKADLANAKMRFKLGLLKYNYCFETAGRCPKEDYEGIEGHLLKNITFFSDLSMTSSS